MSAHDPEWRHLFHNIGDVCRRHGGGHDADWRGHGGGDWDHDGDNDGGRRCRPHSVSP